MKRVLVIALAAVTALAVMAAYGLVTTKAVTTYKDGVYEASAQGKMGPVKVKVVVEGGRIKSVDVVEHNETPFLSDAAISEVPAAIVAAQSADVDSVTGATVTSDAIKDAVRAALKGAVLSTGVSGPAPAASTSDKATAQSYDVDVAIIGAGGAGLSAAVEAAKSGASVIVLEKMPMVGGNTVRAVGGINAAGTRFQAAKGINDSPELFYQDTLKGGKNLNDPSLVRTLANKAAESVEWLISMGADLSDVTISGGASVPRTHRPADGSPVGVTVVKTLNSEAQRLGIKILLNTQATEIMTDANGKVTGVKAVQKGSIPVTVKAKAVVLATGGFGANQDMVTKYRPELKGFGTTNHPGATGDGLVMAEKLGAAFVDIDQIQIHPTVIPGTGILVTEAVRGDGAILVNRQGQRFINELETRDVTSAAVLKQPGKTAFLIFDQGLRSGLKAIEEFANYLVSADSIEALGSKLGIDGKTLAATVASYNKFVAAGKDEAFGRKNLAREIKEGPFYAVEITPGVHHTMGGVKINTSAQVIARNGQPIPGLYAAGEVTGGVHGANRLGGNAVADIVTFGRIAGENAAAYAK